MNNIETAIEAIEAEKKSELEKLNRYDDVIATLKKLQIGNFNDIANSEDSSVSPGNVQNGVNGKELFKDYPHEKKLSQKLLFLDTVLKRPFRASDRLIELERYDGDKVQEYRHRISQQLNSMIHNMTYIAQKYGCNTKTFYFRIEWATWDGKKYTIKPEYEITPAEFEAAAIPEHKRTEFEWVISKAAKTMAETNNSTAQ